jgi:hypothetical protein
MPYKFNESRRHKIPKANTGSPTGLNTRWCWSSVEAYQCGLTEEAITAWQAPATGKRGGQPIYSAIAIETSLALRLVLQQPLRQTEGLL